MTVAAILKQKGRDVITSEVTATVHEVAKRLAHWRIGALLILDEGGDIVGIVSERDIVHALAERGAAILSEPIARIMISNVITCSPDDSVARLMEVMTENRVRHLPVVTNGRLEGIISIGDVVKMRIAEAELEAEEMKRYIVS
ncbi:CBS domain-containing protein [Rhodoligotrophos defluvii]|uniref:CBS domain-containing protein n=1 Tax=Rhodoligotrophos defluvii TaxID=2561934 RepID=UPI0010C947BD|nr:CBS domain-containing protein [Rhodoligotrophos defluvii]